MNPANMSHCEQRHDEASDTRLALKFEHAALQPRMVQWYPGHIAKAERDLKEQLGNVDLVMEVRDARCHRHCAFGGPRKLHLRMASHMHSCQHPCVCLVYDTHPRSSLGACRIPLATSHPQLPGWAGNKPLLLVLNRVDMVSPADQAAWAAYFRAQQQATYWTDAKSGAGVRKVGLLTPIQINVQVMA